MWIRSSSRLVSKTELLPGVPLSDGVLVDARKLLEKIKKKGGSTLKAISENLVDKVWGKDKPAKPQEPLRVLDLQYAGKGIGEKVDDLRKELEKKKSSGFIVCK